MLDPNTLTELKAVLIGGVLLWVIGRVVHLLVGRTDEIKRIHGQFIPEWIGGVYIAAGLFGLFWFGPAPPLRPVRPSLGLASFGLLAGLAVGWIHGTIRLHRHRNRQPESKPNPAPDDGNPYRPP